MFTILCFVGVACLAMTSNARTSYSCKQEWKTVLKESEVQLSQKEEDKQAFPEHDLKIFVSGSLRAFFQ